jgi:predicted AAA+ superfamily ATPase
MKKPRSSRKSKPADAFVWHPERDALTPVHEVNRLPLHLLLGVDRARDILLENTRRFAVGLPANNALLWGARGMGKSSLIKAVHGALNGTAKGTLALVEIHREDINSLPRLLERLRRDRKRRYVLFCDDLSFDTHDSSYKSLKALLEGGIEGRPENVVFYATSNRRHLMPRDMIENERSTAIHPSLFRHRRRLREAFRAEGRAGEAARGCERVVGDARRAVRPRRLAVHPGLGRASRTAPDGVAAAVPDPPRYRLGSMASEPLRISK